MRASQVPAAGKPSSISSASGALAVEVATGGFHSGPAAAMMTSVASVSRSSVSHHGVRCGVSSLGEMSNRSRVGGKLMRRGCGGMSRSSHHSTGRLNRPSSTSGCAKPSGSHGIMRGSRVARPRASGRRSRRREAVRPCVHAAPAAARSPARSVRWMVKLQPSLSVSARISARWRARRVSYSLFQASARPAVIEPAPSGSMNSTRPE